MDRNAAEAELANGNLVAPRRGAWIEISWGDGCLYDFAVAPRRGAWIEISLDFSPRRAIKVAPRRGAWIEIKHQGR